MKSTGLPPAVLVAVSAVLPEGTARASTWPKPMHGPEPDISASSRLGQRDICTQYEDHVFRALLKYIGDFDVGPF